MDAPDQLPPGGDALEAIARATIAGLPPAFRAHLGDVVLLVEEFADDETLDALGIEDPYELTGLYHGRPLGETSSMESGASPGCIHLYRRAILDEWVATGVGLTALVAHVTIHEIGHHFGLSDADMHALEDAGGRGLTDTLAFRGVTCVRGGRTLFEDLTFAIPVGGAALVRGPNGVGKSSLIRIAAGLLPAAVGAVSGPPARALLAEASALDAGRTLADALHFWALLDPDPTDARGRVARALEAVGLAPIAEVPVRLLSTGQRRRAALARVVASSAALWLLDEPANGLDVASVAVLERLIAAHRATGGAVLVATHTPLALPAAVEIALA